MRTAITFASEDTWLQLLDNLDIPVVVCGTLVARYPMTELVTAIAAIQAAGRHNLKSTMEIVVDWAMTGSCIEPCTR